MKENKINPKVAGLVCKFFDEIVAKGKSVSKTKKEFIKNNKLTQKDAKDLEQGLNDVIFCHKTINPDTFNP